MSSFAPIAEIWFHAEKLTEPVGQSGHWETQNVNFNTSIEFHINQLWSDWLMVCGSSRSMGRTADKECLLANKVVLGNP